MGKESKSQFSLKKVKQYILVGRAKPVAGQKEEPKVYRMRVFAPNTVIAKSKFWTLMRKQKKIKHTGGELIAIHEIIENPSKSVKVFGIVLRYQSRTGYHNMYKEYRDTNICGAMSQMCNFQIFYLIDMDMAGRHRAREETIHIVRTCVVPESKIKRAETKSFTVNKGLFIYNIEWKRKVPIAE
jgi:large subunit ribosomal protein L18Ae